MSRVVVVALLAIAGCHANDPCAGKSGVCLTVEATGSGIPALDQLFVTVTDGSGAAQTGTTANVATKISLPVQFAALLRDGTSGNVNVDVVGNLAGAVVAEGSTSVTLPSSGHTRVTVPMALVNGGGGDMAGGGGGDGGGDLALPTGPTLTPPTFDLRVDAMQTGKVAFTCVTPINIMIGPTAIVPPSAALSIDPMSTCTNGSMLPAHSTCSVIVNYAPVAAQSLHVQVQLGTSVGTPSASLRARAGGLITETIPSGSPPNFNAVYAVDSVNVYAVGDNNAVWHRTSGGWSGVTGPNGGSTFDSVWAAADNDVYVASSSLLKIFHSIDRGTTWQNISPTLVGTVNALAGMDATTVFAAGGQGDIAYGSATTAWTIDKASDTLGFDALQYALGTLFAARSDQILVRDATMSPKWNPILDAAGAAHFYGVWGAKASDFYAVGVKTSACPVGSCGTLYHKVGGNTPSIGMITGCAQFNDVWGGAIGGGGGFNVYAVGTGGVVATTPNGDSWSQLTTSTTATLNGVRGAENEVYIVGAGGTILHWVE